MTDPSVTITLTRAEAVEIVALLRAKAYEQSSADTPRTGELVADAARPLLDGYLEPENWAALRAAVEAEEAAIRAVAAGRGEFTDGTAVVLPADAEVAERAS